MDDKDHFHLRITLRHSKNHDLKISENISENVVNILFSFRLFLFVNPYTTLFTSFQARIEQYFEQIGKIITAKKILSRVIFMLRDVVELRDNKWVPRREEHYNPKTIEQIHKEAQMEKMQEQRSAAQMPVNGNKQKKGGPVKVY